MRQRYLSRSWIHPALLSGRSRIHGSGVLTSAPLKRGEKLMEFGGHAISANRLTTGEFRTRSVWLVREGLYLGLRVNDPLPSLDENLNHSCQANGWLFDEVTLLARRDIAAGEEITLDQGTWNFEDKDYVWDRNYCSCGARVCRRKLTPVDWKLTVVQGRYRGHFHPLVRV